MYSLGTQPVYELWHQFNLLLGFSVLVQLAGTASRQACKGEQDGTRRKQQLPSGSSLACLTQPGISKPPEIPS